MSFSGSLRFGVVRIEPHMAMSKKVTGEFGYFSGILRFTYPRCPKWSLMSALGEIHAGHVKGRVR